MYKTTEIDQYCQYGIYLSTPTDTEKDDDYIHSIITDMIVRSLTMVIAVRRHVYSILSPFFVFVLKNEHYWLDCTDLLWYLGYCWGYDGVFWLYDRGRKDKIVSVTTNAWHKQLQR